MVGARIFLIFLSLFIICLVASCSIQEQDQMLHRTYGGVGRDTSSSFQLTSDGGYIIVGSTDSFGEGLDDIWLVRIDSAGNVLWNRTYGGIYGDSGRSVRETADGGYIILGDTSSYGNGDDDIWLIRTNSSGYELWNKTFGGIDTDRGFEIIENNESGFLILGMTRSSGKDDIWLIKTNSSGNEIWNRTLCISGSSHGQSIKQSLDGGYIIAGWVNGAYKDDILLIKTDSSGNEQWSRVFQGSGNSYGYCVLQALDGGYVIAGSTVKKSTLKLNGMSKTASNDDVMLIKTDCQGNEQWNRTFGGWENDYGRSIYAAKDGGYIIAGYTGSYGVAGNDAWLIKTNSSGFQLSLMFNGKRLLEATADYPVPDEQFNRTFGGPGDDRGYFILETSDDRYSIIGYTESFGAGNGDIWLIWY